jgi:restriction system protein
MDITFHYPPELLGLLVDTIPRLARSKKDVLMFFRGAGVSQTHLAELAQQVSQSPASVNKFDMVRTVLARLNAAGESELRARREVLKRVVEFEDFSGCWENDRLEAQGLVHRIRTVVNVKDSFTRMKDELERERAEHRREHEKRAAEHTKREAAREEIKRDLFALFAESNPWRRGKQLEAVLNRLFAHYAVLVREAFVLRGDPGTGIVEQIDGVIELDGHLYLVEIKWHGKALGVPEVSQHLVRVFTRGDVRAVIISDSEFSEGAIQQCRDDLSQKVVVLCVLEEIVKVLESGSELGAMLRAKVQAAIIDRRPFARFP